MTRSVSVTRRLTVEHIVIRDVRNLQRVELDPAPRLNVISGNNGQGKTSILEALYFLATSRSFRTAKLLELVRHEATCASVRGRFCEQSADDRVAGDGSEAAGSEVRPALSSRVVREQAAGLDAGRRSLRIDDEPPQSLAHYATRSPLVVFDPSQLTLSTGPAPGRRQLLDRVTLFTDAAAPVHRARYARALKARQRILMTTPPAALGGAVADELGAFETLLATHGAAMTEARVQSVDRLAEGLREAFARIATPGLSLDIEYKPGGSVDSAQAAAELASRRSADCHRHRTSFGPHLDDLVLRIDGHPARAVGSQGQHRAITLALKLAELGCIAEARGLLPVFLLDDVSSELDPDRSQALLDYLAEARCQIFLTTTRRDLVIAPGVGSADRLDLIVDAGQLAPAD